MKLRNRAFYEAVVFFLIVFSLSIFLFKDSIALFPSFIHAWTQSDRYALALGFLNNDFDFFHPQTFNLITTRGITQVDFPINEYIVAFIMWMTGMHVPMMFRIYILMYGLVGLYFLFKLTRYLGGTFFNSLFVSLFIFSCPVFAYYLDGFIPSIPSFSNCIIAFYFFFRYQQSQGKKDFSFAILFFTLAALSRTPFVIFLFAAFCTQILFYFRKKRASRFELKIFLLGFASVIIYYLYNSYLQSHFGSQFLSALLIPDSLNELKEITIRVIDSWKLEYFTKYHYFALVIILCTLPFKSLAREGSKKTVIIFYLWISFTGVLMYFLVMARQFPAHDYYFIDSFYPVVSLFLAYAVARIKSLSKPFSAVVILTGCIFIFFFLNAVKKANAERYRTQPWDRAEMTRQNFTGTEVFFDSIGVPRTAKVLVIDSYTTNTALILMNRMGYTVITTSKKNIDAAMKKPFDIVAIQNCFVVSEVLRNDSTLPAKLVKYADNGLVSFYRIENNPQQTTEQFLGISNQNTLFQFENNFSDDSIPVGWNKINLSGEKYFSPSHSLLINEDDEYYPSIKIDSFHIAAISKAKIFIRGNILRETDKNIELVAAVSHNDENYYYQTFSLRDYTKASAQWQDFMFQFVLPELKSPEDKVVVYFWNPEKGKFYMDDLELTLYR
jgi:hypothetical protein